ncbi:MAG: glycosyltransferase family 39 protein [Xanthobacteraceae bacterium]|nr:glycosyltransferase family 39 protein [Xanthobacteraceae bacterium]
MSLIDRSRALNRFLDALSDPKRNGGAIAVTLLAYCALWTLYATVSRASQDIHFDMGEMIAWSRELALGTPKHPPLPVWLTALWFGVFPLQEWAFYLLSMAAATLALWVAWLLAGRYLPGDKRAAGLALMTLVPFFNFLAIKYNANAAMTPTWALTTWFFLRSFESRSAAWAALAGLAAAAAMLTKYWAVILLIGLGIASLADPRRARYFRSAAPYVTIAVGAAALAPHLWWLYGHGFAAFGYALESHPATLFEALRSGVVYVVSAAGYVAIPVLMAFAVARPSRGAIADTLWPADSSRRTVVVAFALPLLLPTLAAVFAREEVIPIWTISTMTLLPVVLLSSPLVRLPRTGTIRILAIAIALPIVCLLASPIVALVIHFRGIENHGTHYRLVAQQVEKRWHEITSRPLRLVGGTANLLYGSMFYFADRPSDFEIASPQLTPWVDDARIAREGIALFCPADDGPCMKALDEWSARSTSATRSEIEVSRRFLGTADQPERYVVLIIPPQ